MHRLPIEKDVDDFTGDALVRPAFEESKLKEEVERYQKDGKLLQQFFKQKGRLHQVDASGSADQARSEGLGTLALAGGGGLP